MFMRALLVALLALSTACDDLDTTPVAERVDQIVGDIDIEPVFEGQPAFCCECDWPPAGESDGVNWTCVDEPQVWSCDFYGGGIWTCADLDAGSVTCVVGMECVEW